MATTTALIWPDKHHRPASMHVVFTSLILWLFAATAVAGDVVLVIHGGAGVAPRAELSRQKEAAVRAELEGALRAGFGVLSKGGSAVDAVSACVVLLEDSPLFNAGRGAALNALGQAESTGGLTNKRFGRVGDSPIIGAGTYADEHCGVSATGWGEFFIRVGAARDICARMRYRNDSVSKAAGDVLDGIGKLGGDGGIIALDHHGNVAMPFNTQGMYRGTVTREGKIQIAIYRD